MEGGNIEDVCTGQGPGTDRVCDVRVTREAMLRGWARVTVEAGEPPRVQMDRQAGDAGRTAEGLSLRQRKPRAGPPCWGEGPPFSAAETFD